MEDDDKIIQLVNCSLIKENEIIKEDLWMRSGTFINPEKLFYEEKKSSHVKLDCRDNLIAPGFIDLQINGKWKKKKIMVTIKKKKLTIDLINLFYLWNKGYKNYHQL